MADKFQNGLTFYELAGVGTISSQRQFARWLVEWCTQVLGFQNYDNNNSGRWTGAEDTGTHGSVASGFTNKIDTTGDTHTWSSSDINKKVTITGFTDTSYNGIYSISSTPLSTEFCVDRLHGVNPVGFPAGATGLAWRLWDPVNTSYIPTASDWAIIRGTYSTGGNYDLEVSFTAGSALQLSIGPYATWNGATHAWDDLRYTTKLTVGTDFGDDTWALLAVGDTDRIVIHQFNLNDDQGGDASYTLYIGQINAFYPAVDTAPSVIMAALGTSLIRDSAVMRWLGDDDSTTISGYLLSPCCVPWNTGTLLSPLELYFHRTNIKTGGFYMASPVCESITAGHMEIRGSLRRFWISPYHTPPYTVFGSSDEYLHIFRGISVPWNGSVHYVGGH